jgi:hypothetical protein
MTTPLYTVQVEISTTATVNWVFMVKDEDDLNRQIALKEAEYRNSKFVNKPQKDKQGKIIMYKCNKDWDV